MPSDRWHRRESGNIRLPSPTLPSGAWQHHTAHPPPPSLSTASLPPRWVLNLQCQGSRNVLSALRKAVEVDFKDKEEQQSQGIYLFTGGIPDQDMVGEPRLILLYPLGLPHLPLGGRLVTSFSSMIFPSRLYHLEMLFKCRGG